MHDTDAWGPFDDFGGLRTLTTCKNVYGIATTSKVTADLVDVDILPACICASE
jgi:hypothetical protein